MLVKPFLLQGAVGECCQVWRFELIGIGIRNAMICMNVELDHRLHRTLCLRGYVFCHLSGRMFGLWATPSQPKCTHFTRGVYLQVID